MKGERRSRSPALTPAPFMEDHANPCRRQRMSREPLMDGQTLDELQHAAFGYFLRAVNPANGLIADTSRDNSPVSIAVVGLALSSYPVAVERGWMDRADAVRHSLAALLASAS